MNNSLSVGAVIGILIKQYYLVEHVRNRYDRAKGYRMFFTVKKRSKIGTNRILFVDFEHFVCVLNK